MKSIIENLKAGDIHAARERTGDKKAEQIYYIFGFQFIALH